MYRRSCVFETAQSGQECVHMTDAVRPPVVRRDGVTKAAVTVLVAALTGVTAALSPVSPTGSRGTDAAVTFFVAAFVAWTGASAPWWAITIGGIIATTGSAFSPWMVLGILAVASSVIVGFSAKESTCVRVIATGLVVVALLHLRVNAFLGESAIVAGVVMVALTIGGVVRRPRSIRSRVLWTMFLAAILVLLSAAGMAAGALQAKNHLQQGTQLLTDGLGQLRNGDTTKAAVTLRQASTYLRAASGELDAAWTRPARLLPVVAQHRALANEIVTKAARASAAAADALAVADVEQLRLTGGQLDVATLGAMAQPFAALDASVADLAAAFDSDPSPWLIGAVRRQLTKTRADVDRALTQTHAIAALSANGPAMLGTEGTRHYLVAFTAPGTARGQGGAMDDYAEITVTNGKIAPSTNGLTAGLIADLAAATPLHLQVSPDYFDRYGALGAGSATTAVDPNFWSNATVDPDTPTTANVLAQMYAAAGHGTVDGVIIIDPVGISSLLQVAGPVDISVGSPPVTQHIDAGTLRQFLLFDQYQLTDADRQVVLQAAAGAALRQFLGSALPGPQQLGRALGPPATEGHISWWVRRPAEQEAIRLIGMAARLPAPDGHDGLAIVSNNLGGNTIDPFLKRTVVYRATYDAATHAVAADLVVTLQNTAPTTGYGDYVIGNTLGLAVGTNRTSLSIYSPLAATAITLESVATTTQSTTELGWNVSTMTIDLAAGQTRTIHVELGGRLTNDGYALIWRPQPMTTADTLSIDVSGSRRPITFSGQLVRTSVIDETGIRAQR